jgi:integrase
MNFSEYSEQWSKTILTLSKPATVVTMRSHLAKLNKAFGSEPLDMDYSVAQGYFTNQARLLAPKTTRNLHSTFHAILSAAMREGLICRIPHISLPKASHREQPWIPPVDLGRIIHDANTPYKPFYALLAETGLRIGEALGLQREDINEEQATLSVRRSVYNGRPQDPKTPSAFRTLSISQTLCHLLHPVLEIRSPKDFLFCSKSGRPWWPDKIQSQNLAPLSRDLKLEPVGFHGFRRGNATLLCSVLGCPEKIAAYRLGHAAPGLTLGLYAQSFVGMDKDWVPKLEKVLYGGAL